MIMMIVMMITVTMLNISLQKACFEVNLDIWTVGEDQGPFEPLFSEHTKDCFTTVQIITVLRIGNSQGKSADHQRGFAH